MNDDVLDARLRETLEEGVRQGAFPGAAARLVTPGGVVAQAVVGAIASHDEQGRPIPVEEREPLHEDVLFDIASLTKVATAITVLSLVDSGELDLDAPVRIILPEWAEGNKRGATLRHLLTHTAGLRPTWYGWRQLTPVRLMDGDDASGPESAENAIPIQQTHAPTRAELLADIAALPLDVDPGTRMSYSCVSYITAMLMAETVTGRRFDELVAERVTRPLQLGLHYLPDPARCAPTEYEPELGRGMVRGVVHDESAWALGGVSGNAGLFGTLDDVARLGDAIAARLPGILSPRTFDVFFDDQLPLMLGGAVTAENSEGYGQSCGLRVGQEGFMGRDSATLRGHTGFTGTSLVVSPEGAVVTMVSNRVHITRNGPELAPLRRRISDLARGKA